jgi:glucose-6-phosphate isomerase
LVGQTPVKALGATAPAFSNSAIHGRSYDKVITFLTVLNFQHDYVIPNLHPESEDVSYLGEHKLSELLNAERLATEIALTKAKRPNANIIFLKLMNSIWENSL